MKQSDYSFDELRSGIVKTLKTLLPMIERTNLHYLVKKNCSFGFDDKTARMFVIINRESLSDKEFREVRARVAKCAKLGKVLNNFIKQYKLKLQYADASVKTKQLRQLLGLIDEQIKQTQGLVLKVCEKKKITVDFNDLSQLSEKPSYRKISLLALDSMKKCFNFHFENINHYEF